MEYVEVLLEKIAALPLWTGEEVQVLQDSVLFTVSGIGEMPDAHMIGEVRVERRETPKSDWMVLRAMLAKCSEDIRADLANEKLYELTMNFRNGVFYLDDSGTLCVESSIPIIRDKSGSNVQLFYAQYTELTDFLNIFYPYLLKVVTAPEEASLQEYVSALVTETE